MTPIRPNSTTQIKWLLLWEQDRQDLTLRSKMRKISLIPSTSPCKRDHYPTGTLSSPNRSLLMKRLSRRRTSPNLRRRPATQTPRAASSHRILMKHAPLSRKPTRGPPKKPSRTRTSQKVKTQEVSQSLRHHKAKGIRSPSTSSNGMKKRFVA